MKVVYSKEDQKIIDSQIEVLQHFDTVFMSTMEDCQITPEAARRAMLDSPERALLLKTFMESRERMSPSFILTNTANNKDKG